MANHVSVIKGSKRSGLDQPKVLDLSHDDRVKSFGNVKKRFLNRYLSEEAKMRFFAPLRSDSHGTFIDNHNKIGSIEIGQASITSPSSLLISPYLLDVNSSQFNLALFNEYYQRLLNQSNTEITSQFSQSGLESTNNFSSNCSPHFWGIAPPPLKSPPLSSDRSHPSSAFSFSSQPFNQQTSVAASLPNHSQQALRSHNFVTPEIMLRRSSQSPPVNVQNLKSRASSPNAISLQGRNHIMMKPISHWIVGEHLPDPESTQYQLTVGVAKPPIKPKPLKLSASKGFISTRDTSLISSYVPGQSTQLKQPLPHLHTCQSIRKTDNNKALSTSQPIMVVSSEDPLLSNTTITIEQAPLIMENRTIMPLAQRGDNDNHKVRSSSHFTRNDKCLKNSDQNINYQVNLKDKYCFSCERNFEDEYSFKLHLKYIHNNNPKTFVCRLCCQFTATSLEKFKEHCARNHRSFQEYLKYVDFKPASAPKLTRSK